MSVLLFDATHLLFFIDVLHCFSGNTPNVEENSEALLPPSEPEAWSVTVDKKVTLYIYLKLHVFVY